MIKALRKNISQTDVALFVLTLAQLAAPAAQAGDYDVDSIHIAQPWARATPKGATSGAAYMTITNKGSTSDRVNCVSSDASGQCQIPCVCRKQRHHPRMVM
jgi:periplasmic copper chaperone A